MFSVRSWVAFCRIYTHTVPYVCTRIRIPLARAFLCGTCDFILFPCSFVPWYDRYSVTCILLTCVGVAFCAACDIHPHPFVRGRTGPGDGIASFSENSLGTSSIDGDTAASLSRSSRFDLHASRRVTLRVSARVCSPCVIAIDDAEDNAGACDISCRGC